MTVAAAVPGAEGVPETAPPAEMLKPAGSPVAEKLYGGVPPEAEKLAENAVPTVAEPVPGPLIFNGAGVTVTLKPDRAALPFASDIETLTA